MNLVVVYPVLVLWYRVHCTGCWWLLWYGSYHPPTPTTKRQVMSNASTKPVPKFIPDRILTAVHCWQNENSNPRNDDYATCKPSYPILDDWCDTGYNQIHDAYLKHIVPLGWPMGESGSKFEAIRQLTQCANNMDDPRDKLYMYAPLVHMIYTHTDLLSYLARDASDEYQAQVQTAWASWLDDSVAGYTQDGAA
jgi:hypothetical protein